ncbi:6-phosphofructokinase [Flexistipes sinusarabici DSM 4947]|uniref:ATP-dependent 6-phosphofructokinase n=1 Tax=Flexistipes sinusarabici (strain ATCC 49648 / DSM 4947 / MAS 10) TaxID=717231 RepID=F8E634_FLESM|nr:6-phosphofructokinase [Flexistipes sinusarabici]AEI14742.1 6-phosphofructokinase [Flexistipes sinusarabici DSM 4947]
MKRIAVMTSGGDCPGMNAAIRSVVRTALNYEMEVYGIEQGYSGLMEDQFIKLESRSVANMIQRGGTFLRSARAPEFKEEEGQLKAMENLKNQGIEGLIVIGGDGSLAGAKVIHDKYHFPVIGIPGSIDNDIYGTDMSIGVDTALNTILWCIDTINDTASSHDRTFIIEVMGRNCGYLALMSAISGGAEAALIPEVPFKIENIIKKIKERYEEGKTRSVIILAEGVGSAGDFGKTFDMIGGFETRITVLGHIQRGGSPTHFDRILATRMGASAVDSLLNGESGVMTALQERKIELVPLGEVLNNKRKMDKKLLEIAEVLSK